MKIVLDIETVQAPRLEWARVRGIELASRQRLLEINLEKFRTEPVYDTMAIWSNWDMGGVG